MSEFEKSNNENIDYIYKAILLFFKIKLDQVEKLDIKDVISSFYEVKNFIENNIHERFNNLSDNEVYEGSAFDEIDREEDKELGIFEEEKNRWELYNNMLDSVIRFSIKQLKQSLNESLNMDLIILLDYVKSEMEYIKENKDETPNEDYEEL